MEDVKIYYYKKIPVRIIIFLLFYGIFFLYMSRIVRDNQPLIIFVHTLMFFIFIISSYKLKWGLYLFIFLIPLLNSQAVPFVPRPRQILLFLFFGLFLGFLVNNSSRYLSSPFLRYSGGTIFDSNISQAMLVFVFILILSSAITVYRYSNFYPFITNNYYNLDINLNGTGSTDSMIWTIRFFYNYLIGFLFFILVFNAVSRVNDIIISMISLISATVVSAGVVIYQYYFNPYLGNITHWVVSRRFNATFTDPNALGAFTILMFPVYIGLLLYFKRWQSRLLILLSFLSYLILLAFSGSRSAFIGIILALTVYAVIFIIKWLRHIRRRWVHYSRTIKIILIVVPVIILSGFISLPWYLMNHPDSLIMGVSLVKRTVDTFSTGIHYAKNYGIIEGLKSISNYRHIFWGQAVEMFKDYPLTGVGQGSYILQLPNYLEMNRTGFSQVDYAGNYYLQVLSELGIPGMVVILFIIYLFINKVFKYYRIKRRLREFENSDWLLAALFISFISMLAGLVFGPHTNFTEVQLAFWLITGLMIAYIKVKQAGFPHRSRPLQLSGSIRFDLCQKISLAVILIVFASSFIISSVTTLSLNVSQNYRVERSYRGWENKYGLHKEETADGEIFRWTGIDASEVIESDASKMIIPMKDAIPVEPEEPLSVKIFVDNLLVKRAVLEYDEWTDVMIDIPEFARGRFTLTLIFSRGWVPRELGLTADTRELGIRMGEYRFIE
jgi:O-antigen ligase